MKTLRNSLLSQCPRGHFCFFHMSWLWAGRGTSVRLNALAGIFVFSTSRITVGGDVVGGSQCPRGHFCFFHSHSQDSISEIWH